MCGLCGALGTDDHWSRHAGATVVGTPIAERHRQAAAANEILGHYGLKLKVWNDRYMLHSSTGRGALVEHMGVLWAMAEALTGAVIDPLDPSLVERMEQP